MMYESRVADAHRLNHGSTRALAESITLIVGISLFLVT